MKIFNLKIEESFYEYKISSLDTFEKHLFRQLYRADFSGNNREEILFLYEPDYGGTMKLTYLKAAFFGRKKWYSLVKKWNLMEPNDIKTDVYYDPFKG